MVLIIYRTLKAPGGRDTFIAINKGTLTVKNGTITKTASTGRIFQVRGGTLKIVSGTYTGGILVQKGKLQIDSGTFSNLAKNNKALIEVAGGSAVIKNGTFKATNGPQPIVNNMASLTVSGGTFTYKPAIIDEQSDSFSPEFDNGAIISTHGSKSNTVISGGTFQSKILCAYVYDGGSLTIQKGSEVPYLTATNGSVIGSLGGNQLLIKNGKFKAAGQHGIVYNGDTACTVSGGIFNSQWTVIENDYYGSKGTVTVSGGTFVSTMDSKNLAMFLNHVDEKMTFKGGKITGKKTYGYWTSPDTSGKIVVSDSSLFMNTLGEKTGYLFE